MARERLLPRAAAPGPQATALLRVADVLLPAAPGDAPAAPGMGLTLYSSYTFHHASPGISSQKRCFAPSKDAFFWRSHPEGSDTTGFDEPAAAKV